MRATRSGAWLLVLICAMSLIFLLGAADSESDDGASKDSKAADSKDSDEKAADSSTDGKESLPLLAIPAAPPDDEADADTAAADGVTASSRKLPPKEKKKTPKSGTIEAKGDKARADQTDSKPSVADDGEAIDVLVSSNVKAIQKKPVKKTSVEGKSKQKEPAASKSAAPEAGAPAKPGSKPKATAGTVKQQAGKSKSSGIRRLPRFS